MIIHLAGSSSDMEQDYPFLRAIIEAVQKSQAELVRNWVETANHRMTDKNLPYTDADWEAIMNENTAALAAADAVIVEGTHNRFSQGYQMATALQLGKPVLLLYRSGPSRSFSGMKHNLLTKKSYDSKEDINALVADFIKEYQIDEAKLHLDYKMTPQAYGHIEALSNKLGKTEEQVLNEIVAQHSNNPSSLTAR